MSGFTGIHGAHPAPAPHTTSGPTAGPTDLARQAIERGDFRWLVQELVLGTVNGNTRTRDGTSLLVHALRQPDHACGAFVLLADHMHAQGIAPDLPPRDVENDTLLHLVARHLPDGYFDDALPPPDVVSSMRDWIAHHATAADLACRNRDGRTPVELAGDRHHPNTERFLKALASERTS